MVIKKSDNQQYDEQTLEAIDDVIWEQKEREKELKQVQGKLKNIKGHSTERTIQAFNEEFRKKQLVAEGRDDFPYNEFIGMQKLRDFDRRVDPSTIKKTISNMSIQPVSVKEKDKVVTKYVLIVNGKYKGSTEAGVGLYTGWSDGWYLKPVIQFMVRDSNQPYDPQTGRPIGEYKVRGKPEKIYTIHVPEDKKERRALFEKIVSETDTLPEELHGKLNYRQGEAGSHGGAFSWDQFCDLEIDQLRQIQKNNYYLDSKQTLRNAEGQMVQYNNATKMVEAIQ